MNEDRLKKLYVCMGVPACLPACLHHTRLDVLPSIHTDIAGTHTRTRNTTYTNAKTTLSSYLSPFHCHPGPWTQPASL